MGTYNIVESLGVVAQKGEWTKEVNLVSWNGNSPKVDIREWNADHTRMKKGITLTFEETEQVCMILHNLMRERR